MIFVFVVDYIKGLFEAPFSSTVNGLSIVGLCVGSLLALWLLSGFAGALRDIFADLMKKLSRRAGNSDDVVEDDN